MNTQEQKDAALRVKLEVYAHHEEEIRQKQTVLRDFAQRIVDAHCPYKVGDRVAYTQWDDENPGVICEKPQLRVSPKAIDGLWIVVVMPTRKDGRPHRGKSPIVLGKRGLEPYDSIRLVEAKS